MNTMRLCPLALLLVTGFVCGDQMADEAGRDQAAVEWLSRFAFVSPAVSMDGVAVPSGGELPAFSVVPAMTGRQLVRVSLPFVPGTFPAELSLAVSSGDQTIVPDVRFLTFHPGRPRFVRRAMVTFPYDFSDARPRMFQVILRPSEERTSPTTQPGRYSARVGEIELQISDKGIEIRRPDQVWRAELLAPDRRRPLPAVVEVVEQGNHYLWVRLMVPDPDWPRIIEVRADSLGGVGVRGHLQRLLPHDGRGRSPDFGWRIHGPKLDSLLVSIEAQRVSSSPTSQSANPVSFETLSLGDKSVECSFESGKAVRVTGPACSLDFPDAHLHKRGRVVANGSQDSSEVTYWRCLNAEKVPHQMAAWRTATFTVTPAGVSPLNALLEPAGEVRIATELYDAIYDCGLWPDLSTWPILAAARRFHIDSIAKSLLSGDDFGNVTAMPEGGIFGMNRLNHCPPIFEEYYRSGDRRLRAVALHWCENFYDLSIWWGMDKPGYFGGTRYNNMAAHHPEYADDKTFMWRSEDAVSFCTKGYDSFLYAYEETGDPRMATALRWQVDYAGREIHVDRGECRNIGDVIDFVRLYRWTGLNDYLEHGLRLFRELRTRLSEGDLFSQGGQPIEKDPPFINDDAVGTKHPFAKPYIIGYALSGLPALAFYCSDEPKLLDVIHAVARFQAGAQDPVGGWRYPHPRSTHVSTGMEQAMQLTRAAASLESIGQPVDDLVDAIERSLQSRILVWARTGQFFNGLSGWEQTAGLLKDGKTIYDLYKKPADRNPARDYAEGQISIGNTAPEAVVYFSEILAFYLAHRPPERLMNACDELKTMLDRLPAGENAMATSRPSAEYPSHGVQDLLPIFRDRVVDRLAFPLRYRPDLGDEFTEWRVRARETLLDCLLTPPPRADFQPVVTATEDRGTYEARKLVFSVSNDSRIPAYLLVPKGKGPFPAVLALHDHGAHFSIGKEKVIRPFNERKEVMDDARDWVNQCYGGRWFGDELAKRGYVVFSMDALFWGERGRKEGVDYTAQQALSSNLLQLGMTWSGVITWEDIYSAEFVASLPEVDPVRIAAAGLSMGCHRTWMLCAASDRVVAGVAICWMGTTKVLTSPGNNQTKGHSAYSMLVPGLRNFLDYPDVAGIACPKPMLFFNGEQDGLFPIPGVNDAYAIMRGIWESQDAGDRLATRIWPVKHEFNAAMQDEAFEWLDRQMKSVKK